MDELIDILDDQGNLTGRNCLKSIAHIEGLNHATVHIWFYTPEGNILLQQRAATKKIYPLLWDVSVAGHVNSGESLLTAAIREVKEEVNVQVSDIKYFSSQSWPFPAQLMLGYFCKYIKGEIALNDMELEDARWFNIKDLPIIPPDTSISGQLIRSYIEDHSKL